MNSSFDTSMLHSTAAIAHFGVSLECAELEALDATENVSGIALGAESTMVILVENHSSSSTKPVEGIDTNSVTAKILNKAD